MNGLYTHIKFTLIDPITHDVTHGRAGSPAVPVFPSRDHQFLGRCIIFHNTRLGIPYGHNTRFSGCYPVELHIKNCEVSLVEVIGIAIVKNGKEYTVADCALKPLKSIEYLRMIGDVRKEMRVNV